MTNEKLDKWIDRLERVIKLIKPRFHNAIARTVIVFGLALCVEAQINIFEAMAVAVFEHFFGPSDFLRSLFATSTNVWVGVVFVIFGLIYNALVTVGLELVEKYKAAMPEKPVLKLDIINSDGESIESVYKMRGGIFINKLSNIPDNHEYSESHRAKITKEFVAAGRKLSAAIRPIGPLDPKINKEFYRERAKFLQTWGGAEIFHLRITNDGSAIAKNVRVEVVIPKLPKLGVSNGNDLKPEMPSQDSKSIMDSLQYIASEKPSYDIKMAKGADEYLFEWSLGDVQAKASKNSVTDIFFRTECVCQIGLKLYCDDISAPIDLSYSIMPASTIKEIELPLLMSKNRDFLDSVDDFIMNGYIGRDFEKLLRKWESEENALIP